MTTPNRQPRGGQFELLNGMRGAAAIAIVVCHFGSQLGISWLVPRGYLAVDFFFLLSGLVVAHAYDRRLAAGMPLSRFVAARIIRLAPLLVLGTLLGAVVELGRPGTWLDPAHFADVASAAGLGLLSIPQISPNSLQDVIFPLDMPLWSLFFELSANLIYGCLAVLALSGRLKVAIVLASAMALIIYVMTFGDADLGSVPSDWTGGFARVGFSFFLGALLSEWRYLTPKLPSWAPLAALLAVMQTPSLGAGADAVFDLAVIFLLWPLVVVEGALQKPEGRWLRLCAFAGAVSYPLYVIHYPLLKPVATVAKALELPEAAMLLVIGGATATFLAAAWWVLKVFDEPVRLALHQRRLGLRQAERGDLTAQPWPGSSLYERI